MYIEHEPNAAAATLTLQNARQAIGSCELNIILTQTFEDILTTMQQTDVFRIEHGDDLIYRGEGNSSLVVALQSVSALILPTFQCTISNLFVLLNNRIDKYCAS